MYVSRGTRVDAGVRAVRRPKGRDKRLGLNTNLPRGQARSVEGRTDAESAGPRTRHAWIEPAVTPPTGNTKASGGSTARIALNVRG